MPYRNIARYENTRPEWVNRIVAKVVDYVKEEEGIHIKSGCMLRVITGGRVGNDTIVVDHPNSKAGSLNGYTNIDTFSPTRKCAKKIKKVLESRLGINMSTECC
jgi:MOSC domain-containing protein YiiM